MARQEINIGIEGNDGTGDSIRDSFKKVNENFTELYAILGQEGKLSFTGLSDTPSQIRLADSNKILVVDGVTEEIVFKELVGDATLVINQVDPGVIRFSSLASALINDATPTLAANLNSNFKRLTNLSPAQLDTDAATKGYVDGKLSLAGVNARDPNTNAIRTEWGTMTGPLILSRNPIQSDDANYNGLIAATKSYVDGKTFTSANNIFVAKNGSDNRTDIPENQRGRSWSAAYATVSYAAQVAEQIINSAPFELGPYRKKLTYDFGTKNSTLYSFAASPLSGVGATAVARMGVDSFTIPIVGTGYELGDVLTLSGGTPVIPAQVRVEAKDITGGITQLSIVEAGVYSALPDNITNITLVGGTGNGARISATWKVSSIIVTNGGSNYGSASAIFSGGSPTLGAEATPIEVGGVIKDVNIVSNGSGYTSIPTIDIYLPRITITTENLGSDFDNDLSDGQLLRGLTSGAVARIVNFAAEIDNLGNEIFDIQTLTGNLLVGEEIEYGQATKNVQVTIEVESGIYYEHFPIRLAANVSIKGTEFRRVQIRPKPGISRSPWARLYFRRDPIIDGIRVSTTEYGYHYLTDPLDYSSTPKNNDEMDVFLANDAVVVRNMSVQGHGGFMMVLDPEGQISAKSPYMQVGSSFTGSTNAKRFAGGQYVDGFVANMPGVLLDKSDDGYKITIGGLYREPQLPTSFVFGSDLYRITLATRVETPYFGAKTLLAANKTFIQTETIAWINSPSGFPNLNYDEDICYRDVGLIVDAVMEDLLYGGYRHSSQAGRLYFSSGSTIIAGQVTQTAAAIRHARDIAIKCIKQELFTPVLGSAGQTTIPSITDGATAQTIVDNCFEIIANIVQYGEAMYKAKALIQANKELIQVETVKFVDQYYPSLNYLKDTCKRDVGLIVDAIAIDMFGDFTESLRAGYSYYRQGVLVYAQDQIPAETDAVNFIGSTITDIIQNITISPLRSKQTFNPSSAVSISANTITLPSHPFTNGSKVQYSNGGGSSITTDFGTLSTVDPYYVYVIDADTIQLFESFDLIVAAEKGLSTALAINITGSGSGSSHTIQFYQTKDLTLSGVDLTNAKVLTGTSTGTIDTAVGYINTIAAGGDSTTVPDIYPQYNCVLDTPYNAMVGGKVILRTPGNKSMLNNDFTQVNDLGYGIFANNNGLIESVSLFTYYCYTAYYSLNGGQIRSVGGSCCNGVYGLRAEGADPNEVPDSVNLKFPLAQTATSYENALLSISNAKGSLTLYVTNYSYLPRNGCVVDIDHTGDSGAGVTLGWRTYNVVGVSTTGLPTGVAALSLANVTSASGVTGIANDLTSKSLIIRQSGELVISGKDAIVSTRPSTALVFSESTANVIRVTAFNPYLDVGAADKDVLVTTRDGFSYVSLPVKKNDTTFTIPPGFGNAGDDYIAIQPLSTANAARLTYQTTGYTVYPSTTGTGGQIFGYQDSIYEITGYTLVNTGLPNAYAKVTFNNVTNPNAATARGTVSAVTKANPAVVTTTQAHMMTDGKKVKFTGVGGMTELNFSGSNYYYIKRQTNTVNITATAAGTNYVTLGSAVSTPALATGQAVIVSGSIGGLVSIQDYFVHRVINSTTITVSTYRINATATIVSTDPSRPNQIVVDDTSKLSLNQAIIFYGTGFGGIVSGTTYYVLSIPDTTHITITATISGTTPVTLTTASGYIWGGTTATLSNATGSVSTVIRSFDSFELYSDSALTTAVNSTGYTTFTSGGTVSAMGGLTYSINNSASNVSLNAGIRGGATGTVTVNISTMRATSVDFLDIGTGSYADTNYPSDIFGPPANTPDVAKQVLEQNKGRVFYVSTDQNGTFKVGDFFGVDQGTGNLTLSAKINLAGIETLRLKSGVEINEFSNDTTLGGTGPAPSTSTPTSNAVRTYIDSRLGLSNSGTIVTTGLVGPGYMALDGTLGMKGPMDLNNNRIINVASPTSANDAVPRNYMKLLNLEDGTTTGASSGDLLTFTGTAAGFTKATVTGAITLNRSGTTLTSTLASNYVTDNNIAYTAAIGQYKLNLNTLKAKAADGLQITSYTNQTVGAPRVTLTATLHGFVNGESVVISGETSITSLNGQWTVYNVTTNTFDIALAIPSGTLSSTIRVRSFGLLSAADSAVFTVSANGFLSLNDSTSTTSGVRFTKLAYIDPSVYDATDNQSLSGNSTKVLARRATPASGTAIGAPVPVDARTIVEDGDGLSRAEVPSVGAVVRTATGTGSGKFSTIGYSSTTAVGGLNLVQRDASNGFSAGAVSVTGLTSSGEITLAGGGSINAVGSLGIKMTVNSTTSTVLSRVLDNAGSQAYYVALRDGNGNTAIRLNTGTSAAYQYNAYYATIHNFWDATGSNAGTINVNNGGTLSTGAAANTGQIVGNWSIGSGSRFSATWADLAEWYTSDQEYEPGTIVEFGGSAEVTKSSKAATTRIAGVVSTNPAYVMNGECPGTRVCVALQGRVPCKVVGKISKGDLIVSSQIPGVAISSGEEAKPGTIIGKALENYDSDRIGTIEVAVGRL